MYVYARTWLYLGQSWFRGGVENDVRPKDRHKTALAEGDLAGLESCVDVSG